jgi:D-3-phosphoglycerate dehydrogenase
MKIFIADPIAEKTIEALKKEGHQVVIETELTSEEVGEKLQGFDAVIIRSKTKLRRDVLEKTNGLKVIIRAGVGLDNVDKEAAKEMGIAVRNTPSASARAVAELVIAHMFSLARKLAYADRTMREGKWEKKKLKGIELGGKTLGIIGVGNIGLTVAKMAKGIGMEVLGFDVVDTNKGKLEEINQTLAIDGITHLRNNRSPQLIQEMLLAYLPEKERTLVEAEMAAA